MSVLWRFHCSIVVSLFATSAYAARSIYIVIPVVIVATITFSKFYIPDIHSIQSPSSSVHHWCQLQSVCIYIRNNFLLKPSFCSQIHPLAFHTIRAYTVLYNYHIFLIRYHGYYFFAARFCVATIWGWHLFLWKTQRHQQHLDKVCMSNTVTQYAQPISHAVSHRIESYNTNNSSASLVTIISNYSYTYACVTYTSHSYYSRTAFI